MKGLIFINPFLVPVQSVHQAERLKDEFNKLGVEVEIVSDGYLRASVEGERVFSNFNSLDFAIYLDKDKYLSEILEKAGCVCLTVITPYACVTIRRKLILPFQVTE